MSTKIIIAGGTGALGSLIADHYRNEEDVELVILTRIKKTDVDNIRYVQWDARTLGEWAGELEGAKVVINLVGKSVNCRYTSENKKEIIRSRVESTVVIGEAIKAASHPPEIWINAGSAAIFGNSAAVFKTETSAVGEGFSPEVCKAWEKAFAEAYTPETRKVFLRAGIVLQKKKGVLLPFVNLARWGLGGAIGSGQQYITWIHEQDFVNLISWLIAREDISGIVHAASPLPVQNREFMSAIQKALGIPFGLPSPAFLTKAGAYIIGTEPELVLSGRRVTSEVLKSGGFRFAYPEIQEALKQLLK